MRPVIGTSDRTLFDEVMSKLVGGAGWTIAATASSGRRVTVGVVAALGVPWQAWSEEAGFFTGGRWRLTPMRDVVLAMQVQPLIRVSPPSLRGGVCRFGTR